MLWVIPCPQCGKQLSVNNHKLLGRRGRCPACRHKFLLEVPKAAGYQAKQVGADADIEAAAPGATLKFDTDYHGPLAGEE